MQKTYYNSCSKSNISKKNFILDKIIHVNVVKTNTCFFIACQYIYWHNITFYNNFKT